MDIIVIPRLRSCVRCSTLILPWKITFVELSDATRLIDCCIVIKFVHTIYINETAMVVIRAPKNASSFLSPAASRKRKVKVSNPVIKTPAQMGTLQTYIISY